MSSIEVLVKTAFSEYECRVSLPADGSINDLKRSLSQSYIGNPQPCDQRLIFQGRQLVDTDSLRSAFNLTSQDPSEEPVVVQISLRSRSSAMLPPSTLTRSYSAPNASDSKSSTTCSDLTRGAMSPSPASASSSNDSPASSAPVVEIVKSTAAPPSVSNSNSSLSTSTSPDVTRIFQTLQAYYEQHMKSLPQSASTFFLAPTPAFPSTPMPSNLDATRSVDSALHVAHVPIAEHAHVPAPIPAPAPAAQPFLPAYIRNMFDISLIVKLALLVLLLSNDFDPEKLILFSSMAFVFYLYQVGALAALGLHAHAPRAQAQAQAQGQGLQGAGQEGVNNNGVAAGVEAAAADGVDEAGHHDHHDHDHDHDDDDDDDMWEQLRAAEHEHELAHAQAARAAAGRPVDDSWLKNAERLVVGLLASLFPAWQPPLA